MSFGKNLEFLAKIGLEFRHFEREKRPALKIREITVVKLRRPLLEYNATFETQLIKVQNIYSLQFIMPFTMGPIGP